MGDIEKAKRELRFAKSSADDGRWDSLEPRLKTIEAALDGVPDAEKAPIAAEVAAMRDKMTKALREENSGRVEREIKRYLAGVEDEFKSGYSESPKLKKSIERLASDDARQALTPEAVARLQAEIDRLTPKTSTPVAPPPRPAPTPAATPAPTPAAKPAPPPKPPSGADPDRARAIEGEITRTLRFAAEESIPDRAEQGVERAKSKLDADDAKQHLAPETIQRLRAQADELQTKVAAARLAEKVRAVEEQVGRYLRQAENDLSYNQRGTADMLRHARERIAKEDAKELLSAASLAKFRAEIDRIQKNLAAAAKKTAFDNAEPILKELEERVAQPIFDGSQQPYRVIGDLDSLKARVRGALSEVGADDPDVKAIEKRIAAVDGRIAAATAALGREEAAGLVARAWELEEKGIEGWEDEKADGYDLPKTALAVRRLTWFLKDPEIERLRTEFKDDKEIQATIKGAGKALEAATAKLHEAFEAAMKKLEKGPRPSNRIDLEEPGRMAGRAGSEFEGTRHAAANVARANALYERWQKEIAADRAARQKRYDELSAVAAKAWPAIVGAIKAETEFDPFDSSSKGKTVLLTGIRNRIRWDFSGPVDFAIWVGETPVAGNYEKGVAAAVEAACEKAGLPLDDHTDWDAVIKVGGPGKIKQRFNVVVRDRSNLEIGKIEEWRPVDCVSCTVIALRAGPAAAGPK